MLKLKHLKSNKVVAAIAVVSMYLLAVNMNIYKRSMLSDQHRALAKHLGGGDCSIEPLAEIAEAPESAVKTLLTSYPGSGKRFTFQVIKGLTNHDVADDWDFSGLLKHNPLTVKTSWPHKEGIWSWENDMDQVILLIRNPRWAIPSYHTMRYELNFSQDWLSTFTNMEFVYTKRPNIKVWNEWRDANFETEIVRWFGFIDFWMQGGKPEGSPIQHPRCLLNKIDCKPKVIVDFDNFYQEHPGLPFFKLGEVLDETTNVENIAAQARVCVLDKVFNTKPLHNAKREGYGPAPTTYRFSAAQLQVIEDKLTELKDKYSQSPWDTDELSIALVHILNNYIGDIAGEKTFESMMEQFYG